MHRIILFLILVIAPALNSGAQQFDKWFDGRSLRLDYMLCGNNTKSEVYFCRAFVAPQWAGRRSRLKEVPLEGMGNIILTDYVTGDTLYMNSFCHLFGEWQSCSEAKNVNRAIETTLLAPMPKKKVNVTVNLIDKHRKVTASIRHSIDPNDILIRPIGENGFAHRTLEYHGDVATHIDVAILAEGYKQEDSLKFYSDAQRSIEMLMRYEPFKSLREKFNFYAVMCPSDDSGTSHPHEGKWNRTALGSHFDTFYMDRYLTTLHAHKMADALSCVPYEHPFVIVNTNTYGGGGVFNQIMLAAIDHPLIAELIVHEFGHSYAGLGDEYDYAGEDDDPMYDVAVEPFEANLTTLVDFDSKWADMMPEGTPIPTPKAVIPDFRKATTEQEFAEIDAATQRVGVFEGGGYMTKGVYRPAQECMMKILQTKYFCPVCNRAIRRITDFYTSK